MTIKKDYNKLIFDKYVNQYEYSKLKSSEMNYEIGRLKELS